MALAEAQPELVVGEPRVGRGQIVLEGAAHLEANVGGDAFERALDADEAMALPSERRRSAPSAATAGVAKRSRSKLSASKMPARLRR